MKSYFTKFGAMLLCGVMLAVVGCHDYAEDIQQVNDKVDNLNTSVNTEVKNLEDAIAALDAKVEETYATQAVVDALDKTVKQNAGDIDALESALESAQTELQAALNGKADKAVVETLSSTVTSLQASIAACATKSELEAKEAALNAAINSAKADITALQGDLKGLRDDLTALQNSAATKDELAAQKTALQAEIAAKVDLTAYNAKVEALEAEIESLKKADTANAALIEANKKALDALTPKVAALETAKAEILAELDKKADKTALTALQGQVNDLVEKYNTEMKALTDRVVVLEGLITKVQKIVYVPTAANGKATVNALKTNEAGKYLSAPSTITYKVYPNYLAAELAEVEEEIFSFDEVVVSKAAVADDFKVVSVAGDEKGNLTVTFAASDANTTLLYTDTAIESLSAALVLNHANEHYSTEYTNFVKGKETELKMVLKNVVADDVEAELPYLNSKMTCPVHNGVEVKFDLNGTEYTKDALNKMGYGVDYSVVATDTNNELFTVTPVDGSSYEKVVALAKKDGKNIAKKSHINNQSETVSYTFSSNVAAPQTLTTTVKISDFPYAMAAVAPQDAKYAYEISYIAVEPHNSVDVVPGVVVSFGDEALTVEALQEAGYDVALAQTASYVINDDDAKYFEINNKGNYNNVVTLAKKDDGTNLAGPAQVGVTLGVNYLFTLTDQHNEVVRNNEDHKATVEITKAKAIFDFVNAEGAEAWWMYYPDARKTTFSRKLQLNLVNNVVNGISFSELPFDQIKVETVQGLEVKFSWENDKAYVEVAGFEWDKEYTAKATVELPSADVEINLAFETEGYALPKFTYELGSAVASFPYDANITKNLFDFESIEALCQIPEKNRGDDFTAAKWLSEVLDDAKNTIVKKFNGAAAPAGTSIVLSDDKTKATVSYDYNDFDVVPTTLAYAMNVTTFYGQELEITKGVNEANAFQFVFPTYNIRHSVLWVDATDAAKPYSTVEPQWFYTDGKVSGFSTKKVYMEQAFIVMDGDKELSVQELENRNLDWVFSLELDGVTGYRNYPTITDNVITYDSELESVGVDSKLYLVNDNGSKVELRTNFADNYSNYIVKKYDPLQPIQFTAKDNTIEKVLDKVGAEYIVNLAEYIQLKDKENRLFIDGGEVYAANYIYDSNYFGITLDFNDEEVMANLPYEFKPYVEVNKAVAGESANDCVVKFTYDNELKVVSDIVVPVKVTYTYTWGQTSEILTVVFKAPKK